MSVYSIADYGRMIADSVRVDAYAAALRRAVRPDSVVLDLGTGTGFLALLAAELGARKVYAIEQSDAIQIARETAAANGLDECIEFLFGDSREIELSEPATLMVCDIHGALPWALGSVRTLADARRRMLAPGATIIPRRDVLRVGVVEAAEIYRRRHEVWRQRPHGLDIEVGRRFAVNKWMRERLEPGQIVSEVGYGAVFDYATTDDPSMSTQLELVMTRAAVGHGLAAWFDCDLDGETSFSSGPDGGATVYRQALFFWEEPVALEAGDVAEIELKADFVNGEYIWSWTSRVRGGDGSVRANFRQSAFFELFPSAEHRRKRADSFRPELSPRGLAIRQTLQAMSEGRSLGDIAGELHASFPKRFGTESEALAYVGELSLRYSR